MPLYEPKPVKPPHDVWIFVLELAVMVAAAVGLMILMAAIGTVWPTWWHVQ